MKDINQYITRIKKLNQKYESNDPVEQGPSTESNIYNSAGGFEILNNGEPEDNDYDMPDYDQPNEQYENNASESELSNSVQLINQPSTSFQKPIKVSTTDKKIIKEQQSNPFIYDQTSKSSSDENDSYDSIPNIPYSEIQEFKTLADLVEQDFHPSVELDTKYIKSGIKTLLKVQRDVHGNIIPSADTFYNNAPLSILDNPVIVNGTEYDLGKVAKEFFTSVAVKVDANSEDDYKLSERHCLAETKSQAAYLLIRRFYNLTGFLFEFRNRKGTERSTFELEFKNSTDSRESSNEVFNIRFSLDQLLDCYTISESSRNVFENLFFYSRPSDVISGMVLRDCSIKTNVDKMKERLVTTAYSAIGDVLKAELANVLPLSLIDKISHKKISRNAKNQKSYTKNKDATLDLSKIEVSDSGNENMVAMHIKVEELCAKHGNEFVLNREDDVVKGFIVGLTENIKLFKSRFKLVNVHIDTTYGVEKYCYKLIAIVGTNQDNKIFPLGFHFATEDSKDANRSLLKYLFYKYDNPSASSTVEIFSSAFMPPIPKNVGFYSDAGKAIKAAFGDLSLTSSVSNATHIVAKVVVGIPITDDERTQIKFLQIDRSSSTFIDESNVSVLYLCFWHFVSKPKNFVFLPKSTNSETSKGFTEDDMDPNYRSLYCDDETIGKAFESMYHTKNVNDIDPDHFAVMLHNYKVSSDLAYVMKAFCSLLYVLKHHERRFGLYGCIRDTFLDKNYSANESLMMGSLVSQQLANPNGDLNCHNPQVYNFEHETLILYHRDNFECTTNSPSESFNSKVKKLQIDKRMTTVSTIQKVFNLVDQDRREIIKEHDSASSAIVFAKAKSHLNKKLKEFVPTDGFLTLSGVNILKQFLENIDFVLKNGNHKENELGLTNFCRQFKVYFEQRLVDNEGQDFCIIASNEHMKKNIQFGQIIAKLKIEEPILTMLRERTNALVREDPGSRLKGLSLIFNEFIGAVMKSEKCNVQYIGKKGYASCRQNNFMCYHKFIERLEFSYCEGAIYYKFKKPFLINDYPVFYHETYKMKSMSNNADRSSQLQGIGQCYFALPSSDPGAKSYKTILKNGRNINNHSSTQIFGSKNNKKGPSKAGRAEMVNEKKNKNSSQHNNSYLNDVSNRSIADLSQASHMSNGSFNEDGDVSMSSDDGGDDIDMPDHQAVSGITIGMANKNIAGAVSLMKGSNEIGTTAGTDNGDSKEMSFYANLENVSFDGDDDVNIRLLNRKIPSNEVVSQVQDMNDFSSKSFANPACGQVLANFEDKIWSQFSDEIAEKMVFGSPGISFPNDKPAISIPVVNDDFEAFSKNFGMNDVDVTTKKGNVRFASQNQYYSVPNNDHQLGTSSSSQDSLKSSDQEYDDLVSSLLGGSSLEDIPNTHVGPIVLTPQSDDGSGSQSKFGNFTSNAERLIISSDSKPHSLSLSAIKNTSSKDVADTRIPSDGSKRVTKTYRDQTVDGVIKEFDYYEAFFNQIPQKEVDDPQGEYIQVTDSRVPIERNSNLNAMASISKFCEVNPITFPMKVPMYKTLELDLRSSRADVKEMIKKTAEKDCYSMKELEELIPDKLDEKDKLPYKTDPAGWLSNTAIDTFMNKFVAELPDSESVLYIPSKLYTEVKEGKKYFINKLEGRVTKNIKKILIPINTGNHWRACFVDMESKCLVSLDSLRSNRHEVTAELNLIVDVLNFISKDIDFSNFQFKKYASPQQNNNSDCGVFTVMNFYQILLNHDCTLTSKEVPRFRFFMASFVNAKKK